MLIPESFPAPLVLALGFYPVLVVPELLRDVDGAVHRGDIHSNIPRVRVSFQQLFPLFWKHQYMQLPKDLPEPMDF